MIVLYTGRRGCGKSLTMVKDAFKFFRSGWTVFSNIELGFEHEYISDSDILTISNNDKINNCVLVVDEIQILVDSRRSMGGKNVDFSHFVQQIRKRNIILLCTTQFTGTVDLRLRQHVDVEAKPYHHKKFNVCEVTYIDVTAIDIWEMSDNRPPLRKIVYDCLPIYELYDTMNIVKVKEKKAKKRKKS